MPRTILIIEDEKKLAQLLEDYLIAANFQALQVHDGALAISAIKERQPDLILLDIMLPNKDGIAICKELREFSNVPVIMLTAKVEEIDRILGLEIGADDYICKPFSPREVVARVKAQLRRADLGNKQEIDSDSLVTLDRDRFVAVVEGQDLTLTPVEFRLLEKLSSSPSRVFSRASLMDNLYDDHRVVTDRTIDSHIKNLRKKLANLTDSELIHSIYGVGYKWEQNES